MQLSSALRPLICKRKSTRSYPGEPVPAGQLTAIRTFIAQLVPLFPDQPIDIRIVSAEDVRCMQPWKTPHFIAVSAQDTPDSFLNVGFMLQQLDLFLQSLGLGSCWVGLGRPKKPFSEDLPHAILMPFGVAAEPVWRESADRFSRKPLAEIADAADPRLECVRLAPSATNSQPWYFLHDGEKLHVYQVIQGPLKRMSLGKMNCIDMGIALCHLALTCEGDFHLEKQEDAPLQDGYTYIGTIPAR